MSERDEMRRVKKVSKAIIIYVILSGLFNLLSYSFDQMVIQSELKNRELERKLISSRIELETLSYEISTLNDLSFDIFKSANYFYHHLDVNIIAPEYFFNNEKIQEILGKDKASIVGKNFISKLEENINDFNKKIDEINIIFKSIYPVSTMLFPISDLKIEKKIIDGFNPYSNDNEEEQANRDDRNYEIYSQLYDKISDFNAYEATFDFYLNTAENNYVTNFSDFFNFVDKYAEQQNKINYYILLSIISQILGILFILLLFKSILNQKK